MSEAKERGIIFNGDMVRAIREGRKTQTRRVYKGMPKVDGEQHPDGSGETWIELGRCPYGVPGDRLWVRETWAWYGCERDPAEVLYRADTATLPAEYDRWRPSIHMPRWASRILLEVTEVRVQRLLDISEADAAAEGYRFVPDWPVNAKQWFKTVWEAIHGAGSWTTNPWVWAITFRRVEA